MYLVSTSSRDLPTKNTGRNFASSHSLNKAALTAISKAARYRKSVSPFPGLTRIGGFVRYCLIDANARSHSSSHSARLAPLRVVKKGFSRSVKREIKRPRAANRPVSCWISFLELGVGTDLDCAF